MGRLLLYRVHVLGYLLSRFTLTHWGGVTHICISELTIIGSDNCLLPGQRQAIIWSNAELLLIEPLGTNFSEISIGIQTFSFKKMHLNMSSAKWQPFFLGLNELISVRTANYINCKMCNGITCPFPKFKGEAFDVRDWIRNSILHFTGHILTYPYGVKVNPC